MKKDINFEEALTQLELAVKKLENGSITLDEAIDVYEEAIKLVKVCHCKLENAEQKLKILVESEDGSITDRPFDVSNED